MKSKITLKTLFADVIYDALLNGKEYDEELAEIYEDWFYDDEPEELTWLRIGLDIEEHINTVILGGVKFEEEE